MGLVGVSQFRTASGTKSCPELQEPLKKGGFRLRGLGLRVLLGLEKGSTKVHCGFGKGLGFHRGSKRFYNTGSTRLLRGLWVWAVPRRDLKGFYEASYKDYTGLFRGSGSKVWAREDLRFQISGIRS